MNRLKNTGSLIGGAAVVAAAVGLTVGLAPASAAPQQSPGVSLDIHGTDPANPANWLLWIQGKFLMSEGAAYDRLNNLGPGGGMDYIVYADDPGESDARIGMPHGFVGRPGPPGGGLLATPEGLAFYRQLSVPKGDLNEDGGDLDEVYVKVRFVQGTGGGDLMAYTDVYDGEFGD